MSLTGHCSVCAISLDLLYFCEKPGILKTHPSRKGVILVMLLLLLATATSGQGKDDYLKLSGMVDKEREPLSGVVIRVYSEGTPVKNKQSGQAGAFEIKMDLGKHYTIEFSKKGFVTKKIAVNATVPEGQGGTWQVEFSLGLFEDYPGLDVSALDDPVTKILYKRGENGFGYNQNYTRRMMSRIDEILSQREQLVEEAYQKIIDKADRLYDNQKYTRSIEVYEQALDKRPDDGYPQRQIKRAREKIQEIEQKKQLYQEAVARGDRLLNEKKLDKSKEAYQEALKHRPSEDYPRKQMTKIERLKEERRREVRQKKARYNELIDKADRYFDGEKLVKARDTYKKALNVIPGREHPRERLEQIAGMIEKRRARQQKYERLILQGDKAFSASNYQKATDRYEQAAEMDMNDPYPGEQLARIDSILQAQKEQRQKYEQYVEKGDRAFEQETYPEARQAYSGALSIKPEAPYPKEQIQKIKKILSRRRMKKQKYQEAVAEGDRYFDSEKYRMARGAYEKALEIIPGRQHPEDRLKKIEQILADQRAADERYNTLISRADQAFEGEEYESARQDYRKALDIKPEREYPMEQLQLIKRRLERMKQKRQARKQAKDESYQQAINQADNRFDKEAYREAAGLYEQALDIKPGKDYPRQRLDSIDQILSRQRARKNQYQEAVARGDRLFDQQQYEKAVAAYREALEVKPQASYPSAQIEKIKTLLANRQARQQRKEQLNKKYRSLVEEADGLFEREKYEQARKTYSQAAGIKPGEPYPPEKISQIDSIFASRRAAREKAYQKAVNKGDALFEEKEYADAAESYRKALDIKPDAVYPGRQIGRINNLLDQKERDQRRQARIDSLYAKAIDRADAYFERNNFYDAKAFYEEALGYKAGEEYPRRKIEVCLKKIRELEEARAESRNSQEQGSTGEPAATPAAYEPAPASDTASRRGHTYVSELARKYPEGVTKEHYEKDRRKITRVVVNYNGVADEYYKVVHSWGATYYFRNGKSITREVYRLETRERSAARAESSSGS